MSLSNSSAPPGSSKIAIPRLLQKRTEPPRKVSISRLNRVIRACLSCRARKIKCNGATPRCANCSESAGPCVYASSRKDRLKTSTSQNVDMMALLSELRSQVSETGQNRIDEVLAAVTDDVADAAAVTHKSPGKHHVVELEHEEEEGEANVSAEVGSATDLDLLDEDLLQNEQTRATGFIGKASEIQWLRQLHGHSADNRADGPYGPPGETTEAVAGRLAALRQRQRKQDRLLMHTNKASFFLDDEMFELDLEVDPYELPPFDNAEKMILAYMGSCHNTFPILLKKAFMNQFYHYYAALRRGKPYDPPQKWQAQLNLVFAIAAVYSHLTQAEWCGDERDHLIYHSRAWALSLKDPWWFSHPDLPQMQIAGLLSFYYLSIGHVNRSWVLIGMALRFGYALGLHIRNEDRNTGAARKEELARVWWAQFLLDRHLSTVTGRPSVETSKYCSTPLPLPVPSSEIEETIIESRYGDRITMSASILARKHTTSTTTSPQFSDRTTSSSTSTHQDPANSGSYLKSVVDLSEITQEAMDLYRTSTVGQSWQMIQRTIARLTENLDAWAAALPKDFHIFNRTPASSDRYQREQNILEISYHSTRILITRPCLCRLDRRIKNQTAKSTEFNQRGALTCVESAKAFASLLPDDPEHNLRLLYEYGPWWSMVHTIMQSLVVLLLEVSFDAATFPVDRQEVIPSMKKLARWLRTMSVGNGVAKRAYGIVLDLLRNLLVTIPMDISDILHEDEVMNAAATVVANSTPPLEARVRGDQGTCHTTMYPEVGVSPSSTPAAFSPREHVHFKQSQGQHNDTTMPDARIDPMIQGYLWPLDQSTSLGMHMETEPADSMHTGVFADTWESSGTAFPGLFFTSFDEQNPLPGFGWEDLESGTFEEASQEPLLFN